MFYETCRQRVVVVVVVGGVEEEGVGWRGVGDAIVLNQNLHHQVAIILFYFYFMIATPNLSLHCIVMLCFQL